MLMETIAKMITASRGNQGPRKDRDLIQDTGGSSKGVRNREPEQKPPREDNKNTYRTKDRPNKEKDTDTDKSMDKKTDKDTRISAIAARLAHEHVAVRVSNVTAAMALLARLPPTFRQAVGA